MIIGYIQFEPVLGRLKDTIDRLDRLLSDAANADLIVLPELCNSGYNFESAEMAWETSEEIGNSIFIKYLEDKCSEYNLFIASGFNERDDKFLFNSAILVGPNGYVGKYRKLHLFMNEKDYFMPGDMGLPVFEIGLCRIGLLVCFDWIFPEAWRILALRGADVICHPSNLVLRGFAQKAIPVHALINHVFVVTCNRIGFEGDLKFTGLSLIASPEGVVLREASDSNTEIGIVKINLDLARNKMITPRNQIFEDRRPEEYKLLVEPQIFREDLTELKG